MKTWSRTPATARTDPLTTFDPYKCCEHIRTLWGWAKVHNGQRTDDQRFGCRFPRAALRRRSLYTGKTVTVSGTKYTKDRADDRRRRRHWTRRRGDAWVLHHREFGRHQLCFHPSGDRRRELHEDPWRQGKRPIHVCCDRARMRLPTPPTWRSSDPSRGVGWTVRGRSAVAIMPVSTGRLRFRSRHRSRRRTH